MGPTESSKNLMLSNKYILICLILAFFSLSFKNDKESFYDIAEYNNLHLSKQVTRTITSYIDTINRDVWKKEI